MLAKILKTGDRNIPCIAIIYLNMKTWRHRVDKDIAKLNLSVMVWSKVILGNCLTRAVAYVKR